MRVIQLINLFLTDIRAVGRITFHPEGNYVLALSGVYYNRLCWDPSIAHRLSLGTEVVEVGERPRGDHFELSRDGNLVCSKNGMGPRLVLRIRSPWHEEETRGFGIGQGLDQWLWHAFGPDGKLYAATGYALTLDEGVSRIHRLDPETAIPTFDDPTSEKVLDATEYAQELILPGCFEELGTLNVLLETGARPTFAPNGKALATWTATKDRVLVLDVATAAILYEVPWTGKVTASPGYADIALCPNLTHVALVRAGQLICRSLDESRKPWRSKKPMGYVTAVAFHPDGETLLAVDRAGQSHELDATTGTLRKTHNWNLGPLLCVAVSPDGTLAAAGGLRGNVILWDLG